MDASDLRTLEQALDAAADPATKRWWEGYLKDAVEFRGVKMADIRRSVNTWWQERGLDRLATTERHDVVAHLLHRPLADDKLAGILVAAEILLPAGDLDSPDALRIFATAFDEGAIADWNTCDWCCVKVLGPLVARNGRPTADVIATWVDAPGLWRRRAAGVAFVNLAPRGDEAFPGLVELVLGICRANVRDPARFAQTGVGWVLRELSRAAPDVVATFVDEHVRMFSREAITMATKRLEDPERTRLLAAHREMSAVGTPKHPGDVV